MSLLSEIQADVTEANADIAAVLRKCKVLAVRLGNKDFQSWVDCELDGYPSENELPDYRIIKHVPSYGQFVGIGWSQINNYPIPISAIPEKYQEDIANLYLTEPISYYSSLVAQFNSEPTINLGWNPDFIAYLSDKILSRYQLTSAWQSMSTSSLVALIDNVKNRVLNFVLEIEAVAPNAGEPSKGEKPIPEARVQQVFNTVILGGSAQIAAGNQTIKEENKSKEGKTMIESIAAVTAAISALASIIELWKKIRDRKEPPTEKEIEEAVKQAPAPTSTSYMLRRSAPPPITVEIHSVIRNNINQALERLKRALSDPANTQQGKDKEVQIAEATVCAELERLRRLNNGQLPRDLQRLWEQFRCS